MSRPAAGPPPKVSVVSITYNPEAYIRDALDGFLAQQTDFPFEVIIADDASTDRTPAILREYAERHPAVIRPILRPENVGITANLTVALTAARGQYLALCEGDVVEVDAGDGGWARVGRPGGRMTGSAVTNSGRIPPRAGPCCPDRCSRASRRACSCRSCSCRTSSSSCCCRSAAAA